jgi:hypothetical protein
MGLCSVNHTRAVRRLCRCGNRPNVGPSVGAGRASVSAGLGRSLRTGRGSIGLGTARMRGRRGDGLLVYTYEEALLLTENTIERDFLATRLQQLGE